ncbi:MAG TPA: hypothetical protein VN540_05480 [Clostridia bacterium]|nr:hypothetical protein [Clostridia bacterium]
MRKTIAVLLLAAFVLTLGAGCKKKNVVFTGVIEEVHENSILVRTGDDVGFDLASVGFAEDFKEPDFDFAVGQTVKLTILPEIAESYPVQVRAVKAELVYDAGAPIPID